MLKSINNSGELEFCLGECGAPERASCPCTFSHNSSNSSSPALHPKGSTNLRASSMASMPPRTRASDLIACACFSGNLKLFKISNEIPCSRATSSMQFSHVKRSSCTKSDVCSARKTHAFHHASAPLSSKSARTGRTVARASVKLCTPAISSACTKSPTTSASASAPRGPTHSAPICFNSRACACKLPSASRNTRWEYLKRSGSSTCDKRVAHMRATCTVTSGRMANKLPVESKNLKGALCMPLVRCITSNCSSVGVSISLYPQFANDNCTFC